jgi:hypothetical protein
MSSLSNMRGSLQRWSHEVFGSVHGKLKTLRKDLDDVRNRSWRGGIISEERELLKKISEQLAREEIMMRQRSRVQWLAEGDRNTTFFHARCRDRARQNKIMTLRREDGLVCHKQEELQNVAINFYVKLFMAQEDLNPNEVIQFVPHKVTEEINQNLCRPFTFEEVEKALFMMKPNKSPGPDGFTAGLYQKHWLLLKDDICEAVLNFLGGGELPTDVNKTILVLIPKIKHPTEMTNFRPISLCNVLCKICSKVLANRLRGILDVIISKELSAFVPGRLITDNVLTAYECIHYLKRKKGKTGDCAIKLNMAKAYDRVEWAYLRSIMMKLGFAESWISTVMKCVETVSFSVRVNGQLSDYFTPTRGIRQGDPISPYLFLICAEGLSSLLNFLGPLFLSKGVRVGIHAPWISHLLFADDCIVFTQASRTGANRLNDILEAYNRGSGQLVNREKSAIFFSKNYPEETKSEVTQGLNIQREALEEKYLGLPTAVGRSTTDAFEK